MTRTRSVLIALGLALAVLTWLTPTAANAQSVANFLVNDAFNGTCPDLSAGTKTILGTSSSTTNTNACSYDLSGAYADVNGNAVTLTGTLQWFEQTNGLQDLVKVLGLRIKSTNGTALSNVRVQFSRAFKSKASQNVSSNEWLSIQSSGMWDCTGPRGSCPSGTYVLNTSGTGTTCISGDCGNTTTVVTMTRDQIATQTSSTEDSIPLRQQKQLMQPNVPRLLDTNKGTGVIEIPSLPSTLQVVFTAEVWITDSASTPFSGKPMYCDAAEDFGNIVDDKICCSVAVPDSDPVILDPTMVSGQECVLAVESWATQAATWNPKGGGGGAPPFTGK